MTILIFFRATMGRANSHPQPRWRGWWNIQKPCHKKCWCCLPRSNFKKHLGAVVAAQRLRQLRIAETEKYAHVTFFFNGGARRPYEQEDRILIPSPKVATYDLKPEMSAEEVTQACLIRSTIISTMLLFLITPTPTWLAIRG